jgi:hypothetical protein
MVCLIACQPPDQKISKSYDQEEEGITKDKERKKRDFL